MAVIPLAAFGHRRFFLSRAARPHTYRDPCFPRVGLVQTAAETATSVPLAWVSPWIARNAARKAAVEVEARKPQRQCGSRSCRESHVSHRSLHAMRRS